MSVTIAPPQPTLRVRILDWQPLSAAGDLKGLCQVRLGRTLVLLGVAVYLTRGKPWVALPTAPPLDSRGMARRDAGGRIIRLPTARWTTREGAARFGEAVITALLDGYPDALG